MSKNHIFKNDYDNQPDVQQTRKEHHKISFTTAWNVIHQYVNYA